MWSFDDPIEFKETVIHLFDGTGKGYGTNEDFHWNHAKRLVELAQLQQGQRVLDVATGTAPAAIMAAQFVGPANQVVGIDITPDMLKYARQNVEAAKLTNIELQEGDAEQLNFTNSSFDVVLCASSIPWFPNIPQALKEFHRVLVSGGKLVFSVFGGRERVETTKIVNELLAPYGKAVMELNDRINTPEKCRKLVLAAGFERVEVIVEDEVVTASDPEESFERKGPKPGGRFRMDLTDVDMEKLKSDYMVRIEELNRYQPGWNRDFTEFVIAYK